MAQCVIFRLKTHRLLGVDRLCGVLKDNVYSKTPGDNGTAEMGD